MTDTSGTYGHTPVLLERALALLAPGSGGLYADVTLGAGGHAEAILEASAPDGRLFGIDRDPGAVQAARARLSRFGDRAVLRHGEFAEVRALLAADFGERPLDGLIADLGISSLQLDDAVRGLSFARSGPLDMRMDPTRGETALELIARCSERELADVIYQLGDERRSRPIARSIRRAYDAGQLETTEDLRRAVVRATGPRRGRIDPATRTFQALRMAVNRELEQLESLLQELPDLLADRAVGAFISFHSLEDRAVKHRFRADARLVPLSKKPLVPTDEEKRANPRARSAKLRAARRVPRAAGAGPTSDHPVAAGISSGVSGDGAALSPSGRNPSRLRHASRGWRSGSDVSVPGRAALGSVRRSMEGMA